MFQNHPETAFRLYFSDDLVAEAYIQKLHRFAFELILACQTTGAIIYLWYPQIGPGEEEILFEVMDENWEKLKSGSAYITEYDKQFYGFNI